MRTIKAIARLYAHGYSCHTVIDPIRSTTFVKRFLLLVTEGDRVVDRLPIDGGSITDRAVERVLTNKEDTNL